MAANPSQAFVWGPGGQALTYEELQRLRAMEAQQEGGIDTSPVGHWTQGAARVVDALAGAMRRGQIGDAMAQNRAWESNFIADALSGSSAPAASGLTGMAGGSGGVPSSGGTVTDTAIDPNNPVYAGFMGGVQQGGVTNPNALAAIASTGHAESRFNPANVNRSWSDPSVSGQPGTAGGIMSWRGDRLNNLYSFAAQRGEQPGNISPQTQAAFFLAEDPQLIQRLQGAQSVQEAQGLMNNAWRFANYDQPGGEAARRLAFAQGLLPNFAGQSDGSMLQKMPDITPAQAAAIPRDQLMQTLPYAPSGEPVDPATAMQPLAQNAQRPVQVASADPNDVNPVLMALAQRSGAVTGAPASPPLGAPPSEGVQRIAQALQNAPSRKQPSASNTAPLVRALAASSPNTGAGSQSGGNALGIDPKLIEGLASGRLSPSGQAVVNAIIARQQQANDPLRQAQLEQIQLENARLRNPRQPLVNAGDGRLFNPNNGQWIDAPNAQTAPTTVEAFDPDTGQPQRMQWNPQTRGWDPIGGVKRPAPKSLPAAVQKAEADDLQDIQTLGGINDMLGRFDQQIEAGNLPLGPVSNIMSGAKNWIGSSDEGSRNYASFMSGLEKLRNDSLRLNKGVQTEGDAERAWNELLNNVNDPAVVRQRLAEIQDINRKAITFKYGLIDNRRSMNGLDALNVGGVVTSPSGQQGAPQQPGGAGAGTQSAAPPAGAPQGARQAPDGNWYVPDPARPGKYLKVQP
ncbi:hypothetical protein KHC28_14280 [Ancylobacter sonchi]|uniref:phage tail tip lysozyme n=1 Tax=Ancylobacter sonchi TaxID=1937790 RepID=UPI001BD63C3C|nr:phage tail tip lysozyme [Ancylobacter sonchi]MBS7534826.1 hypothetical protein [Ancylobacter sonchi]